jgi:hypothetical protein
MHQLGTQNRASTQKRRNILNSEEMVEPFLFQESLLIGTLSCASWQLTAKCKVTISIQGHTQQTIAPQGDLHIAVCCLDVDDQRILVMYTAMHISRGRCNESINLITHGPARTHLFGFYSRKTFSYGERVTFRLSHAHGYVRKGTSTVNTVRILFERGLYVSKPDLPCVPRYFYKSSDKNIWSSFVEDFTIVTVTSVHNPQPTSTTIVTANVNSEVRQWCWFPTWISGHCRTFRGLSSLTIIS